MEKKSIFQRVMISLHDATTDNGTQSDDEKEAMGRIRRQEIKVKEGLESEGMITGGGKWVFGKRISEAGEEQKV